MDPLQLLDSLGGVARASTLLEAGLSSNDLASLARRVRRPKRGVYATADCRRDFLAAIMRNSVLTCASAARDHGLWIRVQPARHHLGCGHGHANGSLALASRLDATIHRGLRYQPHHTLPLAAVEDVVLHALRCLPEQAAVPLAASAIKLHGLRFEFLEEDLTARKSGRVLQTLRKVDLRVESLPEAEALLLLLPLAEALGVDVEPQAFIPGIGRVDFLIAGFLIIEIDGVAFHSDRTSMLRDRERDNSATLSGYVKLRYLPDVIWNAPERFVSEVTAALTGRIRG
ncbi:hypothetical protein [Sinomonas sp. P47F7]|uniref:hypothetical protein n=1 Tax=Sinomonas sp. P47F7 TaxID=3410987 RepID=UPI003BF5659A